VNVISILKILELNFADFVTTSVKLGLILLLLIRKPQLSLFFLNWACYKCLIPLQVKICALNLDLIYESHEQKISCRIL